MACEEGTLAYHVHNTLRQLSQSTDLHTRSILHLNPDRECVKNGTVQGGEADGCHVSADASVGVDTLGDEGRRFVEVAAKRMGTLMKRPFWS